METKQPSAALKSHLMEHIEKWPASKVDIVAACNQMSDVPEDEKKKFQEMLPDKSYQNSEEVFQAMDQAMKEM